jgi:hypothetical protein
METFSRNGSPALMSVQSPLSDGDDQVWGTRMFSLHERTKIRLCRTAFVLTCLAPTVLVLAWAISIRLPGYLRGHEQAIAAHLGLRVRLGAVHIPSPGVVLYESLELSDPETGQLVARLPFAEIQSHSGMVDIQLPYPALVNGHRIDLVWRLVQDHSRGNDDWPALTFRAENVTLGLPGGDQTLTGLAGRVDTTETDWRMAVDFRRAVAGKTQDAKTSFSLRRHRARQGITSNLQLVTGGTPLPCALAESIWPEVTHLGKAADFQGRIVATQAWGHWTTQVVGQVGHIDLDRLIGQQFPHGMSGTAVARRVDHRARPHRAGDGPSAGRRWRGKPGVGAGRRYPFAPPGIGGNPQAGTPLGLQANRRVVYPRCAGTLAARRSRGHAGSHAGRRRRASRLG